MNYLYFLKIDFLKPEKSDGAEALRQLPDTELFSIFLKHMHPNYNK